MVKSILPGLGLGTQGNLGIYSRSLVKELSVAIGLPSLGPNAFHSRRSQYLASVILSCLKLTIIRNSNIQLHFHYQSKDSIL